MIPVKIIIEDIDKFEEEAGFKWSEVLAEWNFYLLGFETPNEIINLKDMSPLKKGKKNIGKNIKKLIKEGKPRKQAIAISLDEAKEKKKRKRKAKK